jgi:hypothetical protein
MGCQLEWLASNLDRFVNLDRLAWGLKRLIDQTILRGWEKLRGFLHPLVEAKANLYAWSRLARS